MKPKTPLRRPCTRCGKKFVPSGKFQKLCYSCLDKASRHWARSERFKY